MTGNHDEMSHDELLRLPVTFDLMTAARALGIGRTTAYGMARNGTFPVRVLHIGGSYRVSRADLLRYLGESPVVARRYGGKAS